jgi:hypothetical protein
MLSTGNVALIASNASSVTTMRVIIFRLGVW